MKKTLLLTCLATLLAFPSCTLDEVQEVNQGTPIGFRTSVATRGTEASKYTLGGFYVTALEAGQQNAYFENVSFTRRGFDEYKSNDNYFWPGNGRTLSFHAYAPSSENMGNNATVTITDETKSIENFVVKTNITDQKDLIYAYTGKLEESGNSVALNFSHKLSKVTVGACTTSDYVYNFAGVKIGGVKGTGSLTGIETNAEKWTLAEVDPTVFEYDGSQSVVEVKKYNTAYNLLGKLKDDDNDDVDNCAFMIPQGVTPWDPTNPSNGGAYIAVNVQINTKDGVRIFPASDDYGWVAVPIPAGTWLAGYRYYYELDFTNGAGYVAPGANLGVNVGSPVLGDTKITLTTSLGEMPEGIENAVANPNMIGKWTVQSYKEVLTPVITTITTTTTRVDSETGESTSSTQVENLETPLILDEEITEDWNVANGNSDAEKIDIFNEIDGIIDNWSIIEIVDGTTLNIRQGDDEVWTKEPYRVNSGNYILIDCYLYNQNNINSTNEYDYRVRPQIKDIKKAEIDEVGYAGIVCTYTYDYKDETTEYSDDQTIKVVRTGTTTEVQTIKYKIEALNSDITE